MITKRTYNILLLAALGAGIGGCMPDQTAIDQAPPAMPARGPVVVGEEVVMHDASPAYTMATEARQLDLVWQRELSFDGATYIAPHFSHFDLPEGAYLVVRTPDNSHSRTYAGVGKAVPKGEGFWSRYMPGDRAVLELYSATDVPAGAVAVDKFARGLDIWEREFNMDMGDDWETKALCGADESQNAVCYQSSEAAAYNKARAVARLMMNGTGACTGWLVGSEGHVMTNEHCIGDASTAANTTFDFMAEGASCGTNCNSWGGCGGDIVADTSTLIRVNANLDYALVKLPTNPTGSYGYLQMRDSGAELNERIYIPQHPQAWGKRIALTAGGSDAVVTTLSAAPCSGSGYSDVGYMADTQGGSSGSPVLGYSDNTVIALHHCANCPNRGVPIDLVINDLGTDVPADAVAGGCSPAPVADAGPDQSICAGGQATIGSAARSGHTYSWSPGGQTSSQITVSPAATTTYTVTATTACGTATDTVTVVVNSSGQGGGMSDDLENGAGNWTTSGLWHLTSNSSCASPGYSSATNAMYYGQDSSCDYNTGSATTGSLTSATITGIDSNSTLSFQYFRQVESYSGSYDQTHAEVSTDNGATWTSVWMRDSSDASANAWTSSGSISLAAYAGQDIRIRFRFDSRDSISNSYTGWFIDDVNVTGQAACP